MTWKTSVLVVANVTAASEELIGAMLERTRQGPAQFTLLLPVSDPSEHALAAAKEMLEAALRRMREAGLEVEGRLGDPAPVVAVSEEFDPRRYDEIIVSTLPAGASKWLQIALPQRIERATGAPVRHVVALPHLKPATVPAPPPPKPQGVLSPLRALRWGKDS